MQSVVHLRLWHMHASNSEACPNARHHLLAISSSSNAEIFSMTQRNIPKTKIPPMSLIALSAFLLSQQEGIKARASTPSYHIFAVATFLTLLQLWGKGIACSSVKKVRLSQPIEICAQFTMLRAPKTQGTQDINKHKAQAYWDVHTIYECTNTVYS